MGADFITRIILDDAKFNDTLNKVKKGLDMTGAVTNGISASLKGLAGQIAAAAGAYEIMGTAINSNSLSQEAWNDILGTAKESVDSFFTSLASGDWSVWEKGVTRAITLGQQYTKALRNMKMAILVGDVRLSTQEKDLNKYENEATDENASAAQREAAFVKFKAMGKETVEYIDNLSKYVNGRLSDMLVGKGIKADKNVRDMIFKYLDPSTDGAKLLDEYADLTNKIKVATADANMIATDAYGAKTKGAAAEKLPALRKQIEQMTAMYPELEKAYRLKLNFGTQEELDQLFDIIDRIVGYEDRLESAKRQIRDVAKDFNENGKLIATAPGGGTGGANPLIPEGSIADLEKRIAEAKTNLRMSVDPESRIALEAEIRRLTSEKHVIEFQYMHAEDPGRVGPRDSNLASLAKMPSMKIGGKNGGGIDKKAVKTNNDFASSLMTISSIMGTVTQMTSEGAAAWLTWGGNLLSSIAAAIPAIQTLIGLKSTEAVTNAVASAAQTPIIGWLLAGAAAAAVIGTLLSIPKFASGGIVPGGSTAGDKVLARVNSGEMILNTGQQARLFSLLNNGGGTNSGASVELKVKGKDLVGVLRNYDGQRKKIL